MRRHSILIAVSILIVMLPTLEQTAHAQSSDWTLYVDLRKSSFGVNKAIVTLYGPFGYVDSESVATGTDAKAIFSVPGSAVPQGYNYKVCVSGGLLSTLLPNCKFFRHSSGGAYISMRVPG